MRVGCTGTSCADLALHPIPKSPLPSFGQDDLPLPRWPTLLCKPRIIYAARENSRRMRIDAGTTVCEGAFLTGQRHERVRSAASSIGTLTNGRNRAAFSFLTSSPRNQATHPRLRPRCHATFLADPSPVGACAPDSTVGCLLVTMPLLTIPRITMPTLPLSCLDLGPLARDPLALLQFQTTAGLACCLSPRRSSH